MPTLNGTRFGPIEYEPDDIVTFDEGLIGFPSCREVLILSHKPDSPFRWLQSISMPELAFLVVDPGQYVQGYAPEISLEDATRLGLNEETARLLLTTAAIPTGKPEEMTLNLCGPIVVNLENRRAKQVVCEDPAYTMKYRVFPEPEAETQPAAA